MLFFSIFIGVLAGNFSTKNRIEITTGNNVHVGEQKENKEEDCSGKHETGHEQLNAQLNNGDQIESFRCCSFGATLSLTDTSSLVQWTLNHRLFSNSISGVTQLLLLAHTPVSRMAVQYFSCHEIEGKYFLRADYSVECYSARWYGFLPYVVLILIVVTISFPMMIFMYLLKHRHELYSIRVYSEFGHLYSTFRRGR